MPEPNSTTAAGVLVGAGIGLTGSIMGAQLDALLLGLIAATLMSFWLPAIDSRKRAAAAVAMSSLVAGYGSPATAAWVAANIAVSDAASLRLPVALTIGALAPTLVPLAVRWFAIKAQGGTSNGQ